MLVAAARVNGQTIPLDQYLRFIQINKSLCQLQNQLTGTIKGPIDWNDPARRDDLAAVRRMSLNELVNADLTNAQATAHHITISSQAVDQLLAELQQQGTLPPSDLLSSLHTSQDDLRILARQALQQQALLQLMPNLTTPDAHIAYIVVKTRATAEEVLAQLQQGASFDTLAGKYSQDRTRGSGGDAGEVVPGQSPPALDRAYFQATPGTVVGPIAVAQPAGRLCFANAPGVEPPISQQQGATLYYIVKVLSRQTVPVADVMAGAGP
jgi:peptidyl-prolyl cis-trans isomerase C